ncbi:hypothetical protein [Sphingomonas sp. 3P27F8]|uniref:hypothetical protein n=1 Tax=Sphingomonas sp. 3P27F8 TaxID=2502213 RepID=UPI0014854F3A|nr:hypothetical protein [Sphingomonas sp. 3P27F8]
MPNTNGFASNVPVARAKGKAATRLKPGIFVARFSGTRTSRAGFEGSGAREG